MLNPRLASRYAKSILDLAVERGQLDEVYRDMLYLQQLIQSSRELLNLLRSPVIASDKKVNVISAITAGKISQMTDSFTKLLISKGRETELPAIITAFIKQYKDKNGIHIVKLTTAAPVSEAVKASIVDQVRKTSDMVNIELETTVDPEIIGGFVLQSGDKLVDASVSYDLKQLSKQFDNNDFIYKLH
jgi:F-type H+-transporting ATPase subunit delta